MPARFVKVDLVDRLSPHIPKIASQALIAFVCAALSVLLRAFIDLFLPSAGPFALTFPFVMFATLFGRWEAGVGVMCFCAAYAWYYVLPVYGSFTFENSADGPRVVVNLMSGFVIVALAEYFRRIVRSSLLERDAIAIQRQLLLEELDHRVKNNFAMVSAMIRMELRTAEVDAADTLKMILGRVESIARAHQALYRGEGGVGTVPMRAYLEALCASLDTAFFMGTSTIRVEVEDVALPRDKAIAVGLVINELCTNAAKHAFLETDKKRIDVRLTSDFPNVCLVVQDNGAGFSKDDVRSRGLGQGLVDAFAAQAGGTLERLDVPHGSGFQVVLSAS